MAGAKYELFMAAKKAIRLHPDWDDAQVAEHVGAKPLEHEIIREARKDYEADQGIPAFPGSLGRALR